MNDDTCDERILKKMKTIDFTAIQMLELEYCKGQLVNYHNMI